LKTDEETQAGLKGLVEFFEYSDTKYGKGRIAVVGEWGAAGPRTHTSPPSLQQTEVAAVQ
jgi:hypothetical protein